MIRSFDMVYAPFSVLSYSFQEETRLNLHLDLSSYRSFSYTFLLEQWADRDSRWFFPLSRTSASWMVDGCPPPWRIFFRALDHLLPSLSILAVAHPKMRILGWAAMVRASQSWRWPVDNPCLMIIATRLKVCKHPQCSCCRHFICQFMIHSI